MVTRRRTRDRLLDFFVDWVVIRGSLLAAASGAGLFLDAVYQSLGGR